ncbi:MAG: DUF6798 domain-containing protein [Planctomycetaceae bacterium]
MPPQASPEDPSPDPSPSPSSGWPPAWVWGSAAVLLLLAGFARSAVPGVNEPHYWTKARHFWQPDWLERDLFLTSANAHAGFYATVGWLAAWLSLPAAVWVARLWAAAVLAWGFTTLARGWGLTCRQSLAALVVWLLLSAPVGLSGEWVLGGVESKVFAWGLLLAAYGAAWSMRWNAAAACAGAATTLHPLVGGWGSLVLLVAVVAEAWPRWRLRAGRLGPGEAGALPTPVAGDDQAREAATEWRAPRKWPLGRGLLPLALFALCATPGLLPVLGMLLRVPSPEIARQATEIQVYERLAHHLLPDRFTAKQVAVTLVWWGLAAVGTWGLPPGRSRRLGWGLWLATTGLAGLGWLVNGWAWRAEILRFYPFRLLDGFAPVAAALALTLWWSKWSNGHSGNARWSRWLGRAALVGCLLVTAAWPFPDRTWPRWRAENRAAWLEACAWIRRETPPDSLWLTPKYSFGFKWWAERAEWAVWKDCPQDAASLVEWRRRLQRVSDWRTRHFETGFDAAALQELTDATPLDYVLAWNDDPYSVPPVFRNGAFSVYRLAPPADTPDSSTSR